MKNLYLSFALLFSSISIYAQTGNDCFTPLPFCTGQTYNYPAGVNSGSAQAGPNYGCLGSQPNPIWYYFQIDQPGNLDIFMVGSNNASGTPTNDIDFICYGPFSSLAGVCPNQLTAANTVDCSFSASSTETVNIVNAQPGQFYLLLITNYSNNPANIIFSQSGGTGTTDCGVFSLPGNNGPLCVGEDLELSVDTPFAAGPYAFYWTGPNGYTSTLQNPILPNSTSAMAGTYTVVLTDLSNFESDTTTTTVIINPIPAAPSFTPTPVCLGQQFCVSPTPPLISGATYTWSGSNGASSTAVPYCNIGSSLWVNATMSLTVTVNGCVSPPFSAPIVVNPVPTIAITGPSSACEGTYVTLNATPNNYSNYTWTNSNATGASASVLPGTYTVSTTQNGCTGTSAPFTVAPIPNPLTINGNIPFCDNDSIIITVDTGKDQYVWNGNPGGNAFVATGTTPNPTILTVVSTNGCERTDTINLNILETPNVGFTPSMFCDGAEVQFMDTSSISLPNTLNSFFWDYGTGDTDTAKNPLYTFPANGTYQVTHLVGASNGCVISITKEVKVFTKPTANFNAIPLCFGLVYFKDTTIAGDGAIDSTIFTFATGNNSPMINQQEFELTFESDSSINVNLFVMDVNGCSDDTTMKVPITATPEFSKLPNVITPSDANGSPSFMGNDYFDLGPNGMIFDKCYDYSITFYNRWGQKVYTITDSSQKFEGKNAAGNTLENGVYYYVIMADGKKRFGGTVTVL